MKLFRCLLIGVLCLLGASSAFAATTSVTLAWDANTEPDLAGYKIYHSAVSGGPYTVAATLGKVTTWTHTGLTDGNHCWVATAYDASNNESGYSNQVCLQTDTSPPAIPGAPRISSVVKVP